MDRREFTRIFYGEGAVPPPWATDCPVKFEVWWSYAEVGPSTPLDLILATGEQHGATDIITYLRGGPVAGRFAQDRQPVVAGSFVGAWLIFAELVQLVLPLTSLGRKIGSAQQLANTMPAAAHQPIEAALAGQLIVLPTTPAAPVETEWEQKELERRTLERAEHLRWFLRVLDAVLQGSANQTPRATLTDRAKAILQLVRGVAVTQVTPAPLGTRPVGTIDRRARHPVRSVTLNRPVVPAVVVSRTTIKADAAEQLFAVDCSEIGWAVVDSGIDAGHAAFALPPIASAPNWIASRVITTYDLTGARSLISPDTAGAIIDWAAVLPSIEVVHQRGPGYRLPVDAHGTHVAGVLGAQWTDPTGVVILRGVAPSIRLYDFRVLNDAGRGDEFGTIAALQLVRYLNERAGRLVIHGVNLSLSLRHDVANYSCGWTPICEECDRLVRSGVVVVAAAGNSGFEGGDFVTGFGYHTVSITDPGNTDAVITVGSTHRNHPHRHGVSYFSSRGPTADGRNKPDLLAPGEDIDGPTPGGGIQAMHGTSQAAAHVSGAAAMLMARYRELRGRPERVKDILTSNATDLGRDRGFQGHGLVDVLRAMQAI